MATIEVTFQQRNDTAATWKTKNPTLAVAEYGIESDTGAVKLGDGATAWNSLPYLHRGGKRAMTLQAGTHSLAITPGDELFLMAAGQSTLSVDLSSFAVGDTATLWINRAITPSWVVPTGVNATQLKTYNNSSATNGPFDYYIVVRPATGFIVVLAFKL